MMTTKTTKTPAEMLLESGLLEQKCDGFMCREGTVWVERDRTPTATKCLACTGTGLRYWRLRRECQCIQAVKLIANGYEAGYSSICGSCAVSFEHGDWCLCQGHGYMVAPDAELVGALMDELIKGREYIQILAPNSPTGNYTVIIGFRQNNQTPDGNGSTILTALVAKFLEVAR